MRNIRRLQASEATVYRDLRLEALRESPEAFATSYESALGRDDASWAAQADSSAQGSDRATFIIFDDAPVGLAALYRLPKTPLVGELLQMWIAPSHRGCGVAAELLDHVFQWAALHEFTSVKAEVTWGNVRALRFYERQGFHLVSAENGSSYVLSKSI